MGWRPSLAPERDSRLDAFLISRPSVLTASLRITCLYFGSDGRVREGSTVELVYLSVVVVFFALSFGMTGLLDRL